MLHPTFHPLQVRLQPGANDDVNFFNLAVDSRGRQVIDHLVTADLAREMAQAPATTWQWQRWEFSVPDDLGCMEVVSRGGFRDWVKIQREPQGDANAAMALAALRPKQPRKARKPRDAGVVVRRARGRGRGRNPEDVELDLEEGSGDESSEAEPDSEDSAADVAVPKPKKLERSKIYAEDGAPAGDISFVYGFMDLSMCVQCAFHGCRAMVQMHRVPDIKKVERWLREGQHVNRVQHEEAYYPTTQIAPPKNRGRGRGRGSGG